MAENGTVAFRTGIIVVIAGLSTWAISDRLSVGAEVSKQQAEIQALQSEIRAIAEESMPRREMEAHLNAIEEEIRRIREYEEQLRKDLRR